MLTITALGKSGEVWAAKVHVRGHECPLSLEWEFEEEMRNDVGDKRLDDLRGTSLRREEQDAGSTAEGELFSLSLIF